MASPNLIKNAKTFVEYHLGKGVFAPFTGQDYPAWRAFVHLLECHAYGGGDLAITAMASVVQLAQPKVWNIFVQSIPAVLDWSAVAVLWPQIVSRMNLNPSIQGRYRELAATERAAGTRLVLHGVLKHTPSAEIAAPATQLGPKAKP